MTKRRPSNKKPTGVNASLGSSLANERRKARISHIVTKFHDNEYSGVSVKDGEVTFFFLLEFSFLGKTCAAIVGMLLRLLVYSM